MSGQSLVRPWIGTGVIVREELTLWVKGAPLVRYLHDTHRASMGVCAMPTWAALAFCLPYERVSRSLYSSIKSSYALPPSIRQYYERGVSVSGPRGKIEQLKER